MLQNWFHAKFEWQKNPEISTLRKITKTKIFEIQNGQNAEKRFYSLYNWAQNWNFAEKVLNRAVLTTFEILVKLLFGARPKAEHQLIWEYHHLFVGGRSPPPKCYLHQNHVTKIWKNNFFVSLTPEFASKTCNKNLKK